MPRVALSALCLIAAVVAGYSQDAPASRWYKGNLHTHTLNSDGDSTPLEVATWYREHGYHFLVLSDHNHVTDISGLNAVLSAKDKFILITGEEVTDAYNKKPIHMNAYNPDDYVAPQHGDSVGATIQRNVNAIRKAKGVPSLNHPNFQWAITVEDMLAVKGLGLFEVYNGHPMVNNEGGGGFKSLDEMWDALLTAGQKLYGIAVDDAHQFKRFGKQYSNPGHGWIHVRAQSLTAPSVLEAIERGDFYATTGVALSDIQVTSAQYRLTIAQADWEKTTTYFIGDSGKVLATSYDMAPVYTFTGSEKYVRARVDSSGGAKAWTQPVFRKQ